MGWKCGRRQRRRKRRRKRKRWGRRRRRRRSECNVGNKFNACHTRWNSCNCTRNCPPKCRQSALEYIETSHEGITSVSKRWQTTDETFVKSVKARQHGPSDDGGY